MDYTQGLKLAKRLNLKVEETLEDDCEAHGLCVYWDHLIQLKGSLRDDRKVHVLLHEICHATGTEEHLYRETLYKYDKNDLYALVEETIVEAATVSILSALVEDVYTLPLKRLAHECNENGIEWDHDILPEVERVVNYLLPHVKVLTRNTDNY